MKWKRLFPIFAMMVLVIFTAMTMYKPVSAAAPKPSSVDDAGAKNVTPLKMDRLDPSIDRIVPAGATMERVATGFKWLEGPIWADHSLYFADIPGNRICKWTPGAGVSTFLQPSGYKGSEPYGGPEPGSNGMTLDARGRLTVAGHAQRDVYRFESLESDCARSPSLPTPTRASDSTAPTISFTGPTARFTSPIRPMDCATQKDDDPDKQLKVNGVYRLPHALEQKPGAPA